MQWTLECSALSKTWELNSLNVLIVYPSHWWYSEGIDSATNFKSFFDKEYTCHNFEEASLSISQDRKNVDRYLIAQKEKTIFVAFQSEASFSKWPQLFNSFEHGEY